MYFIPNLDNSHPETRKQHQGRATLGGIHPISETTVCEFLVKEFAIKKEYEPIVLGKRIVVRPRRVERRIASARKRSADVRGDVPNLYQFVRYLFKRLHLLVLTART